MEMIETDEPLYDAPEDYERPTTLSHVAQAAADLEAARTYLRMWVLRAHREGESLRDIATAAHVSHEQIRRMTREEN